MRKAKALVTCGFIGVFGLSLAAADDPPADYSKAMKDINAATQAVAKAIAAEDYDAVTVNAGVIVDTFPLVEKYWTGKADDAVMFAQTAQKAAADLRSMAGLKSPDGVAFSAKQLTDVCAACHMAHREKQSDGTFKIK